MSHTNRLVNATGIRKKQISVESVISEQSYNQAGFFDAELKQLKWRRLERHYDQRLQASQSDQLFNFIRKKNKIVRVALNSQRIWFLYGVFLINTPFLIPQKISPNCSFPIN